MLPTPVPSNSLPHTGDTAQTIARGIGFRFTDIKTLLYEEGQRRNGMEGVKALPGTVKGVWGIADNCNCTASAI